MSAIRKIILLTYFGSLNLTLFSQQQKIDSLVATLKNSVEDTNKILLLNSISALAVKTGSTDASLHYAEMALPLSLKFSYNRGIMVSYYNMGTAQRQKGNYPEALNDFLNALKICEKTGIKKDIGNMHNSIAIVYYNQRNFEEALKHHNHALKLRQDVDDKEGIAGTYNNIGLIYYVQQKFEDALKNFFYSLKIAKELNRTPLMSTIYANVANIYEEQGNYDEALKYYNDSYALKSKSDKTAQETYYASLGNVFFKQKNYSKANEYLNKGLAIAKETGYKEMIQFCYEQLNKVALKQNDHKAAYGYFENYITYRDSLINQENSAKTLQMQMQYDFDKKATADSIRNVEQAKLEQVKYEHDIKVQKAYTYGGIIGFALMLVVAIVSFKAYRDHQRANKIISQQKDEVEKQKHLVEEKQSEILSSIHYAVRIQNSLLPTNKQIENDLERLNKNQ